MEILLLMIFVKFCAGHSMFELLFDHALSWLPNHAVDDVENFRKEYDFIIVGGGSAGSVLANRLSENGEWSVLLLEAGKVETPITDIPVSAAMMQITGYNWGYKSAPSNYSCLLLSNGVCNIPQGRALGGTSVINFLIHTRGNSQDYDDWAKLGCTGWSFKDVLPYFKRLEDSAIPNVDPRFRGVGGPVQIENAGFTSKLLKPFLKAGQLMSYPINDPNGKSQFGFSKAQATMSRGARCSAAKAYLNPVKRLKNLDISLKTWVTKIEVDPVTKRTIGVEFVKNRRKYFVRTKKEVIVSSGAIGSPRLLMLSGIGPASHLKQLGIPVVQDLKVGFNHQDHVYMPGLTFLVNETITMSGHTTNTPKNLLNYALNGKGPLTLPGGAEGIAFIKTKSPYTPTSQPDIEIVMGPGALNGDNFGVLRKLGGLTDEFFYSYYENILNDPAFSLVPVLLKPKSRGRITLKSKNPFHWPIIDLNFFSRREDVMVLIEGIRETIGIGESQPFQKYESTFWRQHHRGCERFKFNTDQYWECAIRGYASSLHHHSGTCKMGDMQDESAVVDPELRVIGVKGLRVVDASIFPTIPSSHTNSVVYMVAEKAVDMIKSEWTRQSFNLSERLNLI